MAMRTKKWCQKDIQRLTVLYYMGATDQEISPILDRSPQSIEKKITRLKLRPKNSATHTITPGRHLPKTLSPPEFSQILDRELTIIKGLGDFTERYPLFKRSKLSKKKAGPFENLQHKNSQWRSLKEIGHFIQDRRHSVTEKYCSRSGATHLVDGQQKRPLELLMIANKMRLKERKTPFFLENHTQY